jgi:hypothetical protein
VTLALPVDIGSTLYSSTVNIGKVVRMLPYSQTLFAELETRGAYTPASGTLYTIKLNTVEVDVATTGSENLLWAYAGGAVPTLDLEFARTKTLNNQVTSTPPVTFTRASTGTFVGSNGLIQTAAVNEPRFDHNPTTGESLGLLVEEARTNGLTYSEDTSQWLAPTNLTLSQNQTAAPDGASTADQYLETAATGLHVQDGVPFAFVISTVYTYSVFVKSNGGRNFEIGFQPTIFKGHNKMRIFQEEIFGPVVCVTTFKTTEEAIEIANDTLYGLGAGVWTRDAHELYQVPREIKAGRVWVNNYHAYPAHAPFGGYKKSGFGRENHKMMLEHYRQTKNMLVSYSKQKLGFF